MLLLAVMYTHMKNEIFVNLGKTHIKKVFFLVVGPLREQGGVTPPTTQQKTPFFL